MYWKVSKMLQHLLERNVDIDLHQPIIDEENDVATFILYNLSEKIVGYQQYRRNASKIKKNNPKEGKYFTHTVENEIAFFGIESLSRPGTVFLTEGIFDACRLTNLGYPCLASLTNNPKRAKNFLMSMGRKIFVVCDGDEAGLKLSKYGHDFFVMPKGYDLGDCDEKIIQKILEKALVKF